MSFNVSGLRGFRGPLYSADGKSGAGGLGINPAQSTYIPPKTSPNHDNPPRITSLQVNPLSKGVRYTSTEDGDLLKILRGGSMVAGFENSNDLQVRGENFPEGMFDTNSLGERLLFRHSGGNTFIAENPNSVFPISIGGVILQDHGPFQDVPDSGFIEFGGIKIRYEIVDEFQERGEAQYRREFCLFSRDEVIPLAIDEDHPYISVNRDGAATKILPSDGSSSDTFLVYRYQQALGAGTARTAILRYGDKINLNGEEYTVYQYDFVSNTPIVIGRVEGVSPIFGAATEPMAETFNTSAYLHQEGLEPRELIFENGLCVIGRDDKSSNMVLSSDYVSRKHAAIRRVIKENSSVEYSIQDLGSINGTKMIGRSGQETDVKSPWVKIENGDQIVIGKTTLKFIVEDLSTKRGETPTIVDPNFLLDLELPGYTSDDSDGELHEIVPEQLSPHTLAGHDLTPSPEVSAQFFEDQSLANNRVIINTISNSNVAMELQMQGDKAVHVLTLKNELGRFTTIGTSSNSEIILPSQNPSDFPEVEIVQRSGLHAKQGMLYLIYKDTSVDVLLKGGKLETAGNYEIKEGDTIEIDGRLFQIKLSGELQCVSPVIKAADPVAEAIRKDDTQRVEVGNGGENPENRNGGRRARIIKAPRAETPPAPVTTPPQDATPPQSPSATMILKAPTKAEIDGVRQRPKEPRVIGRQDEVDLPPRIDPGKVESNPNADDLVVAPKPYMPLDQVADVSTYLQPPFQKAANDLPPPKLSPMTSYPVAGGLATGVVDLSAIDRLADGDPKLSGYDVPSTQEEWTRILGTPLIVRALSEGTLTTTLIKAGGVVYHLQLRDDKGNYLDIGEKK